MWLWLAACMEVDPSGRPFDPVPDVPSAANTVDATLPEAPASITAGFNFDAEDRPDDADAADERPPTPQEAAAALGLAPLPLGSEPTPALAPVSTAAAPPAAVQAPVLASAFPPPPQGWGVRLVSTVPEAQPPRAILGMADGTETVVVPGDLLPQAHLVVLAIGRDAVQLAEITPVGDHAIVHTYTLGALFPSGGAAAKAP